MKEEQLEEKIATMIAPFEILQQTQPYHDWYCFNVQLTLCSILPKHVISVCTSFCQELDDRSYARCAYTHLAGEQKIKSVKNECTFSFLFGFFHSTDEMLFVRSRKWIAAVFATVKRFSLPWIIVRQFEKHVLKRIRCPILTCRRWCIVEFGGRCYSSDDERSEIAHCRTCNLDFDADPSIVCSSDLDFSWIPTNTWLVMKHQGICYKRFGHFSKKLRHLF